MKKAFLILAVPVLVASAPSQSPWLINELNTGSDMVELINVSSQSADPAGICLWAAELFGNTCSVATPPPVMHICVPPGTPLVPPGGTVVFQDFSSSLPCALVMTRAASWQDRSGLVAWINRDATDWSRQVLDMVSLGDVNTRQQAQGSYDPGGTQWVGGPVMRPNAGCNSLFRPVSGSGLPVDTNAPSDWQVGPSSLSTPCAPNPAGHPNPMTLGEGFSASGNCARQAFTNNSTELPTLTLAACSFNPRPGGSIDLAIRSGMTTAPPLTCLVFGTTLTPGAPLPLASCAANVVTYVNPATAGNVCYTALPWDSHFAADLPSIPVPAFPHLVGVTVSFQSYMLDVAAGACPLRSTNGLRITVKT